MALGDPSKENATISFIAVTKLAALLVERGLITLEEMQAIFGEAVNEAALASLGGGQ